MKSEISRNSHQPDKKYSGVYQQQGRMLTDSDWNESVDVLKAQLNDALNDIVGNGSPRKRSLLNNEAVPPTMQWGYLHVDGIQAEVRPDNHANTNTDFEYEHQQDFPAAPSLPGTGTPTVALQDYRLYADVWERTVTYLQDKRLLDSGLHGADTCTRKQSMAQVKWCPSVVDPEQSDHNPGKGNSELSLKLRTRSSEADPCDPCAAELNIDAKTGNYLFRVEIHDVESDADAPTKIIWKWSSENGAEQFEARAESEMPAGFVDSQWVYEFFSETSEKQLGVHLVDATDFPVRGSLTDAYPATLPTGFDFVRRWDGYGEFSWNASALAWELTYGTDLGTVLNVAVQSSSADKTLMLDGHEMVLQLLARVVGDSVTSNVLGVNDLTINGIDIPAPVAGDDTLSSVHHAAGAIAKAAAINTAFSAIAGDAKVTAEVNANVVTGSAPSAFTLTVDDIAEGDLEINGVAIAAILAAGDVKAQADVVIDAINQKLSASGVAASRGDNNEVNLLAEDGRNIDVKLTGTATTIRCGLTVATSYGSITVSSRSDIIISGNAPEHAGFVAGLMPSVKFAAGDFWWAEVREAEHKAGDVLLDNREPEGIEHHYLELGSVVGGILRVNPEADRKCAFPPLTEMTRMLLAGGDGQEAMPDLELPQPIEVAVANGQWLVKDTSVQFEIVSGSGSLIRLDGSDSGNSLIVETDERGIAGCRWVLGTFGSVKPRVKAILLDPENTPSRQPSLDHPPLFFNASLSTAAEVAYEPHCQYLINTQADTVQKALDDLCYRQTEFKSHNKHLHGWGIVCGLQLECLQTDREYIYVQKGWAIECDGTDLEVKYAKSYPVIDAIQQLGASGISVLSDKGDGDVYIYLEGVDVQNQPIFNIEPYQPEQGNWPDCLSDTLLFDVYNDCIKEPLDAIKGMLTVQDNEQSLLVKSSDKRLISLLNLLIRLQDSTHGQYVYLSLKEANILRDFYEFLRKLLSSKTYCAMYDALPSLPEYPFVDSGFSTVFGPISKGRRHDRLRVHPKGEWGYTFGGNDYNIHVFDLNTEEMIAEIAHPAGKGHVVQDIAFSPDGGLIYCSAWLEQENKTILAVGEIEASAVKWASNIDIAGKKLVSLATSEIEPQVVLAIAKGEGLYAIDPTANPVVQKLVDEPCNAVGHLIISQQGALAYITVADGELQTDTYHEVRAIPLKVEQTLRRKSFRCPQDGGEDDIAIVFDSISKAEFLYVVSGLSNQQGDKQLLKFDISTTELLPPTIALENTKIRLAYQQSQSQLLIAFADSYKVARLDVNSDEMILPYYPVQLSPSSVVAVGERIYVRNEISETINIILTTDGETIDLIHLANFRNETLTVFSALATGFAQYLKDCFCHHLLVECPKCSDDDKIYLGSISIRNRKVSKVCNFSKRKYVKSFPTISYWMSILPLGSLLDKAVEIFCCSILPVLGDFTTVPAGTRTTPAATVGEKPAQKFRGYVDAIQNIDLTRVISQQGDKWSLIGRLAGQGAISGLEGGLNIDRTGMSKTEFVGKPTDIARQDLQKQGVSVSSVEAFSPQAGTRNLIDFIRTPDYLKAGDKVTLYEQDGQVKYYALDQETTANVVIDPELEIKIKAIDAQSEVLDQELSGLAKKANQMFDSVKDQSDALNMLEQRRIENAAAIETQKNADFTVVEASIEELKKQKLDLESKVAGLKAQSDSLSKVIDGQAESVKTLNTDVDKLSMARAEFTKQINIERVGYSPVNKVTGVNADLNSSLREIGVRTTADLAGANAAELAQNLSIPNAKAKKLIAAAKTKMQA